MSKFLVIKSQKTLLGLLLVVVAVLLAAYVSVRMYGAAKFFPVSPTRVVTQADIDAVKKDIETSQDIKFYEAGDSRIAEVKGKLSAAVTDNGLVYVSRVKLFDSSFPEVNIIVGARNGTVLFGVEKPLEVNYIQTPLEQVASVVKIGDIVSFKIVLPKDPSTSKLDPGYIAQQTAFYDALKNFEQSKRLQDPNMHFVVDQLGVCQL